MKVRKVLVMPSIILVGACVISGSGPRFIHADIMQRMGSNISLPAPPTDETFNYYERFGTGVRSRLTSLEMVPNGYPFIMIIKNSLTVIDNIIVIYRDNKDLAMQGQEIDWQQIGPWQEELNKQVCIINMALAALTSQEERK
jgi:hypothetical protein